MAAVPSKERENGMSQQNKPKIKEYITEWGQEITSKGLY